MCTNHTKSTDEICPICENFPDDQQQNCWICNDSGIIIHDDNYITEETIKTIFSSLNQK